MAEAMAENHRMPIVAIVEVPAGGVGQRVGDAADDADVDDRLDEHEQPDEEEQGVPLDVAQRLVRIERADDHQDGRAEQRDGRRLEPERGVEQEADEGQGEDDQAPGSSTAGP